VQESRRQRELSRPAKLYNTVSAKINVKYIICLLLVLLIGCTSHRVDDGAYRFVDREDYAREKTQVPVTPNETVLRTASFSNKVGTATLIMQDNKPYIRVTTSMDRADLQVYLSNDVTATNRINLGPLPKYAGTYTLAVPPGMEQKYQYVLLWSRTENILFSSAELT
jgi:hypothetical protein